MGTSIQGTDPSYEKIDPKGLQPEIIVKARSDFSVIIFQIHGALLARKIYSYNEKTVAEGMTLPWRYFISSHGNLDEKNKEPLILNDPKEGEFKLKNYEGLEGRF